MTRADQSEIRMRIVIDEPVIGVAHSFQSKDGRPLDAQCSEGGEPLAFDFATRARPAPNSSATRCDGKAPSAASSMSGSDKWLVIRPRPGPAG